MISTLSHDPTLAKGDAEGDIPDLLVRLDGLRDRRRAGTLADDEYHAEEEILWKEIRRIESEGKARLVRQRTLAARREKAARTDVGCPYKTLRSALADGWHKAQPDEYSDETVMLKGHRLVRKARRAASVTQWGREGYRVRDGEKPHAHVSGRYSSWAVYRKDQVVWHARRRRTVRPPEVIPILAAVWAINRHAKRIRDQAAWYWGWACADLARKNAARKRQYYRIKGQCLHWLQEEGALAAAGHHRFPGGEWAEVLRGGEYTFHRPCPMSDGPDGADCDVIESRPRRAGEPRLTDALHTVEQYLNGRPPVQVYEWPVRRRVRDYWAFDEDDDQEDREDSWEEYLGLGG